MVAKAVCDGLIVSTGPQSTAALDELIACCGWPAVWEAKPRRLREELQRWQPACLLFWLQDQADVAPTVALVRWIRQQAPEPIRVALAYRLGGEVEAALRTAGVDVYLPASESVGAVVERAVWPLLERRPVPGDQVSALPVGQAGANRGPLNLGTFPELGRPP